MLYAQLCQMHCRSPLICTQCSALCCTPWPFLPQMKIQLPFCSFQVNTLAREICINTWCLLSVSTERTAMLAPLSCSSSNLWQQHTGTPVLRATRCSVTHLQGCRSSPLLFTFCATCSTQTSLYIEVNRKIPAINQMSRHSPHIRHEDVEQPKYSVTPCLCFTALLFGCRCFTNHYPLHRL